MITLLNRCDVPGNQKRSIKEFPESITALEERPKPQSKPTGSAQSLFGFYDEKDLPIVVRLQDFPWLLARHLTRAPNEYDEEEEEPAKHTEVPVWSGYNSLVNTTMDTTRVGTPPLLAAPAHEWNTLITVLKQAQNISTMVVGRNRKTVISLDMGLYQPAKKLQMSRNDLNTLILRTGEL